MFGHAKSAVKSDERTGRSTTRAFVLLRAQPLREHAYRTRTVQLTPMRRQMLHANRMRCRPGRAAPTDRLIGWAHAERRRVRADSGAPSILIKTERTRNCNSRRTRAAPDQITGWPGSKVHTRDNRPKTHQHPRIFRSLRALIPPEIYALRAPQRCVDLCRAPLPSPSPPPVQCTNYCMGF